MVSLADSLRSFLSKNALLAFSDIFRNLRKLVDHELDIIVPVLMKKATDTNIFLSEEAETALANMCAHCSESKVVAALAALNANRNALMRARLAKCYEHLVRKLGNKIIFSKEAEKIVS